MIVRCVCGKVFDTDFEEGAEIDGIIYCEKCLIEKGEQR